MPEIVADSVDAFVFRKSGSRVQFLLLQRETTRSFAGVWQSMHTRIEQRETTLAAARRSIRVSIGVDPLSAYSIDYVGQIFDHERDLIVLSPTIAFAVRAMITVCGRSPRAPCSSSSRIRRVASNPFRTGMLQSISTTR